NYGLYIIIIWLVCFVCMKVYAENRKKIKIYHDLFFVLSSIMYAAALLYVTIFSRKMSVNVHIELSVFWEYRRALTGDKEWAIQIINNIVLFVPLGILYKEISDIMGMKTSWKSSMILGFFVSGIIELIQLSFRVGLFEYDDIFNNSIGMMSGYIFCRLIRKMITSR
ncbi:VanZ family protein, partial [Enterocloster clostridioformis]